VGDEHIGGFRYYFAVEPDGGDGVEAAKDEFGEVGVANFFAGVEESAVYPGLFGYPGVVFGIGADVGEVDFAGLDEALVDGRRYGSWVPLGGFEVGDFAGGLGVLGELPVGIESYRGCRHIIGCSLFSVVFVRVLCSVVDF